jgi:hypothetical protein
MKDKISCYINLYNDFYLLNYIIPQLIDIVDEILIVDGPYQWCIEPFKQAGVYYEANPPEIQQLMNQYQDKIKYTYHVFQDEHEKRLYGYNQCTYDCILLIDSDELLYLTKNHLQQFLESNKPVGSCPIINMCNFGYLFTKDVVRKNIFFNRKVISAEDHIDYLWLVGIKQKLPNYEYVYHIQSCLIYHLSLFRTKESLVTKYIFYCSLNQNKTHNIFNTYHSIIPQHIVREVFSNSKIEMLGLPANKLVYDMKSNNELLDNIIKPLQSFDEFYLQNKTGSPILSGIPFYATIHHHPKKQDYLITIKLSHVVIVASIKIHFMYLNQPLPYETQTFEYKDSNEFVLQYHNPSDEIVMDIFELVTCGLDTTINRIESIHITE